MCGRFGNFIREEWMHDKFAEFDIDLVFLSDLNRRKKLNIAPTDSIVTIRKENENYLAELNYWGIKFSENSPLIFNSRIETISIKSFWKKLFDQNRCIVPLTEFYEWKKIKGKKVPYRISITEEELFFVPGLVHCSKDKNKYISLITTEPNSFIKEIHHRMPVIFNIEEAINFLQDNAENNLSKCIPYKHSEIMAMEVADI